MQLLIARAVGAQRELLDAIAAPRGVCVTVDETGDRAEPAPVDLLDVAAERPEVAHAPRGLDPLAVAEDVRILEDEHVAEGAPAPRSRHAGRSRRCGLGEVADEQARQRAPYSADGGSGRSRPCSPAAAIASTYPAST